MTILQKSLGVRIFIAVCSFIVAIFCVGCGYLFIIEHIGFLPLVLFFSIGLGTAFLVAGINVLMARIEYDDEKLITRSFKKQKVIYFKDINFFGRKIGASTSKSRTYYWIIKTAEGTSHINFQTKEFEDFVATMQKANPNICIKK